MKSPRSLTPSISLSGPSSPSFLLFYSMNHYVVMDVLPFGKCTIDMETKEVTVPGDERMREYLALESCVSENAELHQIVSFYRCINEYVPLPPSHCLRFKDNLDINLREECTAAAKIIDKETLECFDDLDRVSLFLPPSSLGPRRSWCHDQQGLQRPRPLLPLRPH